jgi:MscS family membrane protein
MKPTKAILSVLLTILFSFLLFFPDVQAAEKSADHPAEQVLDHMAQKMTAPSATTDALLDEGHKLNKRIDSVTGTITKITGIWITDTVFGSITWLEILTSLALLLLVFIFERIVRYILNNRLGKRFKQLSGILGIKVLTSLLDAVNKPMSLFILVYGAFWSLSPVLTGFKDMEGFRAIPNIAAGTVDLVGYFAMAWFAYRLSFLLEAYLSAMASKTESDLDNLLVPLLGKIVRVLVVFTGFAIVIHGITGLNFGPIIASLGIGGAAIALAAKDSIGNFLGSITIVFDKPFTVGDRIVIDSHDGVVEQVGFRSTKLRTPDGHLVTIPNEKVINTTINNIGKQPFIRWNPTISLALDTPPDKVKRAVEIIRGILENHEGMNPDQPPSVYFNAFNASSLNIGINACYHPPVFAKYAEWMQATSLRILETLAIEEIELARVPQSFYLAGGKKAENSMIKAG